MLLAIAIAAFVSLGLPDGVLGVAWPSIRRTFDLPLSQLGSLLAASMTGYLLSTFSSGWAVARLGMGRVLLWSTLLMVANSGAYALAPTWWIMVASSILAGLGAGAIDAGLNIFAATHLSPRLVTWLHASYGIGVMLGPLLMTGILASGLGWRCGYAVVGAVLSAMAVSFFLTVGLWRRTPQAATESPSHIASAGLVGTLGQPRVWLNISLFFVYTGLEVTTGQWTYSLFTEGRGFSPALVGTWIGCYWASLTAGRVISGAVASRVSATTLLRVATVGAPLGALLIWSGAGTVTSFMGLTGMGFSLAPIYPLSISETPRRLGSSRATVAIGFQVAAACLGTAALPGLAGLLASRSGLEVIGPFLFAAAVTLLVLQEIADEWTPGPPFRTCSRPRWRCPRPPMAYRHPPRPHH
jgi:fucose permease